MPDQTLHLLHNPHFLSLLSLFFSLRLAGRHQAPAGPPSLSPLLTARCSPPFPLSLFFLSSPPLNSGRCLLTALFSLLPVAADQPLPLLLLGLSFSSSSSSSSSSPFLDLSLSLSSSEGGAPIDRPPSSLTATPPSSTLCQQPLAHRSSLTPSAGISLSLPFFSSFAICLFLLYRVTEEGGERRAAGGAWIWAREDAAVPLDEREVEEEAAVKEKEEEQRRRRGERGWLPGGERCATTSHRLRFVNYFSAGSLLVMSPWLTG